MIPFNPSRVLEQLPNYTRPTLSELDPSSNPIEQPLLRPKTPENTTDINAHLSAIFSGLQDLPINTPTWPRILQLVKFSLPIQQEINTQLRAANTLKKKSDKRKLSKGRMLTAEEAKKIK